MARHRLCTKHHNRRQSIVKRTVVRARRSADRGSARSRVRRFRNLGPHDARRRLRSIRAPTIHQFQPAAVAQLGWDSTNRGRPPKIRPLASSTDGSPCTCASTRPKRNASSRRPRRRKEQRRSRLGRLQPGGASGTAYRFASSPTARAAHRHNRHGAAPFKPRERPSTAATP